jgi:biopolymer transport protein ExbD
MTENSQKQSSAISDKDAAAVLTRRAKRKIRKFEQAEELNLVPYMDVIMNLVVFLLVTISSFPPLGMLNIFPLVVSHSTEKKTTQENKKQQLWFTVAITEKGFSLGGFGAVLEPILKKENGEYDFSSLSKKVIEIKDRFPDETLVILSAQEETPYETVVKTMDILRENENRQLFYNVQLSPGVFTKNPDQADKEKIQ